MLGLDKLNSAQQEAVRCIDGPLLVLAGAGSGKTRVLTHRIAYLLHQGVDPRNIMAITFTNKAAGEMKERVENLLGRDSRDIWVMTFHSACVRILRQDIGHLGYDRNFVIYDSSDAQTVVKECLKQLNMDDKQYPPRAVAAAISDAKNKLLNPGQYRKQAYDFYTQRAAEVYQLYQSKLKQNNALDFDDLIMLTVRLFKEQPQTLGYYQQRFKYILVDEYQDTNHAQYTLVNLLAGRHRNLCVVGDADQSIYKFRGADIQNILDFEKDYPEARVIMLEQNYRSTQRILDAANSVIKLNMGRKDKKLWTENGEGIPVVRFRANDQREEIAFVADRIKKLMEREKKGYKDFAVLYRTNAMSRAVEEVFMMARIPYTIVGGLKFYERKEIKDILAYLRFILNPADSVSLRRIINVPKRGIGDTSFGKIVDFAIDKGITVYEAMGQVETIPGLTARTTKPVKEFTALAEKLQEAREQLIVTQLIDMVLRQSGYQAELEQEKTVEAQTRLENLKEFRTVTKEFDETAEEKTLEEFLAGISLKSDLDNLEEGDDAVVLMTLHSAKGLEFPVVFMVGMEEMIFPHSRSMMDEAELEEERRLCYVGITRARERLYMTHAWQRTLYGNAQYNPASRFLEEIPEDLITTHDPLDGAAEPAVKKGVFPAGGSVQPKAAGVKEPAATGQYALGDKVEHAKFGQGVIVSVKGSGDDAELSIAFPGAGVKMFIAKYAPLRKA
ncbi:MAG: DNA helicase PcrA [Clostridia bacterium]|nr:DNA helicase PcrA [Clostridia bacterium]